MKPLVLPDCCSLSKLPVEVDGISPAETARALKIVPLSDFVSNLDVSQQVFAPQSQLKQLENRRKLIVRSEREAKGLTARESPLKQLTHFHIDCFENQVNCLQSPFKS
jgi:hypothetical protein